MKQSDAAFIAKLATLQIGKKSSGATCPLCGDPKCEWVEVRVTEIKQRERDERSFSE